MHLGDPRTHPWLGEKGASMTDPTHGSHAHGVHGFDKGYWEDHWTEGDSARRDTGDSAPNPYLVRELGGHAPATALDAGCGTGTEAIWLAQQGWRVMGVDISAAALALAAERASTASVPHPINWVEADLTIWQPEEQFDLVTTHYAHATMPQLAFYERIAGWVAPGGTLLIVGHLPDPEGVPEDEATPADATVTSKEIAAILSPVAWRIDVTEERSRAVERPGGATLELHDVVVRATRID